MVVLQNAFRVFLYIPKHKRIPKYSFTGGVAYFLAPLELWWNAIFFFFKITPRNIAENENIPKSCFFLWKVFQLLRKNVLNTIWSIPLGSWWYTYMCSDTPPKLWAIWSLIFKKWNFSCKNSPTIIVFFRVYSKMTIFTRKASFFENESLYGLKLWRGVRTHISVSGSQVKYYLANFFVKTRVLFFARRQLYPLFGYFMHFFQYLVEHSRPYAYNNSLEYRNTQA